MSGLYRPRRPPITLLSVLCTVFTSPLPQGSSLQTSDGDSIYVFKRVYQKRPLTSKLPSVKQDAGEEPKQAPPLGLPPSRPVKRRSNVQTIRDQRKSMADGIAICAASCNIPSTGIITPMVQTWLVTEQSAHYTLVCGKIPQVSLLACCDPLLRCVGRLRFPAAV